MQTKGQRDKSETKRRIQGVPVALNEFLWISRGLFLSQDPAENEAQNEALQKSAESKRDDADVRKPLNERATIRPRKTAHRHSLPVNTVQGVRRTVFNKSYSEYSPYQNALAERPWRSLMNATRCMTDGGSFLRSPWKAVFQTAAYLTNGLATRDSLGETPHNLWNRKEADLSHLLEIRVHVHEELPGEDQEKQLNPVPDGGSLIGYCETSLSYMVVLNGTDSRTVTSRIGTFLDKSQDSGASSTERIGEE